MQTFKQFLIPIIIGLVVGFGAMTSDKMRGSEWVVSPEQIAQAKAEGKMGYESSPGTVTVLPIRSEKADVLPFTWTLYGIAAAAVSFFVIRRKKAEQQA
jgi:hypothetical protein